MPTFLANSATPPLGRVARNERRFMGEVGCVMQSALLGPEHSAYRPVMQPAYPSDVKINSLRQARRRAKLELLLVEVGGPAKAERETGTPKSHFSAILSGRMDIRRGAPPAGPLPTAVRAVAAGSGPATVRPVAPHPANPLRRVFVVIRIRLGNRRRPIVMHFACIAACSVHNLSTNP